MTGTDPIVIDPQGADVVGDDPIVDPPKTAVVDPATGLFCTDGMAPGRIIVSVPENPNPRLQRYSGDPAQPLRDATPSEIAAFDAGQFDAQVAALMDVKQQTFVVWALTREFKRPPTTQELATARAQLAGIYKSLTA